MVKNSVGAANDFRNRLLKLTLRTARFRSRLYREKWFNVHLQRIKKIEDLQFLPLVFKHEIHGFEEDWASAKNVCLIQNTSGSTGIPLFVYRTLAELNFIEKFFNMADHSLVEKLPIALHFSIPQHGQPTPVPGKVWALQSSVHNDKMLQYSVALLEKQFQVPHLQKQVSILTGDHNSILLLTRFYEENPEVLKNISIKVVCTTGRQLTNRWKRIIKETFGAIVVDRYTLSEVFGGATYCVNCSGYHFDPHVTPEIIVNPEKTYESVKEGVGFIALTTLSPFVTNQPFIRYITGDLFEALYKGCNDMSYYPLGRASHSLYSYENDSVKLLLSSKELLDIIDNIPRISRPEIFRDVHIVNNKSDIQYPFVRGALNQGYDSKPTVIIHLSVPNLPLRKNTNTHLDPAFRELAKFLNACLPAHEFDWEIHNVKKESLSSIEKNTNLWINSPKK